MVDYSTTRLFAKVYGVIFLVALLLTLLSGDPNPVVGGAIAAPLAVGFAAFLDWKIAKWSGGA